VQARAQLHLPKLEQERKWPRRAGQGHCGRRWTKSSLLGRQLLRLVEGAGGSGELYAMTALIAMEVLLIETSGKNNQLRRRDPVEPPQQ
jgi:hypothetical protein